MSTTFQSRAAPFDASKRTPAQRICDQFNQRSNVKKQGALSTTKSQQSSLIDGNTSLRGSRRPKKRALLEKDEVSLKASATPIEILTNLTRVERKRLDDIEAELRSIHIPEMPPTAEKLFELNCRKESKSLFGISDGASESKTESSLPESAVATKSVG